jgi:hypothetical protein
MISNGHGGNVSARKLALNPNFRLSDAFANGGGACRTIQGSSRTSEIEQLRGSIPTWIKRLERPKTPCIAPAFGPLEGIRAVGTGQLIARPYIGTKLAEFGAESSTSRAGSGVFRFTAPQLLQGRVPTAATRPK